MILDLQWFGYGAGLVMVGWVCGMLVGSVFAGLESYHRR